MAHPPRKSRPQRNTATRARRKRSVSALAKIAPPQLTHTYARKRLFGWLDKARRTHPVIWVQAPPGSGKTTLIATYISQRRLRTVWYRVDEDDGDPATFFHYLGLAIDASVPDKKNRRLPHFTPEYLHGLPAFTQRYFEQVHRRLRSPSVLVFDNYQEAPVDTALHEVMRAALASLPAGVNVIVVSRAEPPPALARLRASAIMTFLGWDELKLAAEECDAIVRLRKVPIEKDALQQLYERTQGWSAGLVLALEQQSASVTRATLSPGATPQAVFDYFAGEIFERMDRSSQAVLLQAAFLPSMTASRVVALTGAKQADQVLAHLNQRNYFTLKHVQAQAVYQFHPLFREFLLARARATFAPAFLRKVQHQSAALLEADGDTTDAVALLVEAQAWDDMLRIIPQCAQTMLEQGRAGVLEAWLRALPPALLERTPWLLFWFGMCRLAFQPTAARTYFEQAFRLFESEDDAAGLFLSWCGIVDTFVYAWGDFSPMDRWIAVFDDLLARHPRLPSPEIEARVVAGIFTALMYRQPQRPDLPQWAQRVRSVVLNARDVRTRMILGNQLLHYYTSWLGDLANARLLIEAVRRPVNAADVGPLARIAWCAMEAGYHFYMMAHEECLRAVNDGLATAEQTGARFMNSLLLSQGMIGSLTAGDLTTAARLLQSAAAMMSSGRQLDRAHYHFLVFLDAFYRKDTQHALTSAREAVALGDAAGVPFCQALYRLVLAHALYNRGDRREALAYLAQARRIARSGRIANVEFGCLFSAVSFALERGKHRLAIPLLRKTLTIAKQRGYVNRPLWTAEIMTRLFATALEHNVEVDYVQGLIRKRKLMPTPEVLHLERWPWPVKIYTLGGFRIEKDGEPVRFTGKVQRRPLDLLKIVIALGGRDVDAQDISDGLWPDAEGDAAADALATALRRLRLLLGDPGALVLQDNKLTIDARRVWVDVWALDHLFNRTDRAPADFARLLALYSGAFLEKDADVSWVWPLRERLRNRFLRELVKQGGLLMHAEQHAEAIRLFEKGLEVDNLAEELYCSLMRCYQALGRRAEALSIYERCRKLLSSRLGVTPSPETEVLHQALRAN